MFFSTGCAELGTQMTSPPQAEYNVPINCQIGIFNKHFKPVSCKFGLVMVDLFTG